MKLVLLTGSYIQKLSGRLTSSLGSFSVFDRVTNKMTAKVKADVYLTSLGNDICSPFFDKYNALHFLLQNSGEVSSHFAPAVRPPQCSSDIIYRRFVS
jgi:hypothetical protein